MERIAKYAFVIIMMILFADSENIKAAKTYSTSIDGITWVMRDSYIDVGVAYTSTDPNAVIRWQEYDVNKQSWRVISNWSKGNWANWYSNCGDYWLHCEIKTSDGNIVSKTISFHYLAGETQISGTYCSFTEEMDTTVLFGQSSTKTAGVTYSFKVYNIDKSEWTYITDKSGLQWVNYAAKTGNYWIQYELYTSDGRLADYRTYGFSSIEPKRRALFLTETSTWQIPIEDVNNMSSMTKTNSFYGTKFYSTSIYADKTKAKITEKIKNYFANTTENDISYLYISCHGGKNGELFLDKNYLNIESRKYYTPSELRNIIDKYIKGTVIVHIDACYSGNYIGYGTSKATAMSFNNDIDNTGANFTEIFLEKFESANDNTKGATTYSVNARSADNLDCDRIKVFCSSRGDEKSNISDPVTLATKYWLYSLGWDPKTESVIAMQADVNKDNKISVKEFYTCAYNKILSITGAIMEMGCNDKTSELIIYGRY